MVQYGDTATAVYGIEDWYQEPPWYDGQTQSGDWKLTYQNSGTYYYMYIGNGTQQTQQTQTSPEPQQVLSEQTQLPEDNFVKGFVAEPTNIYNTADSLINGKDEPEPLPTFFGKGLDAIFAPMKFEGFEKDGNFFAVLDRNRKRFASSLASQSYYGQVYDNFGKFGWEVQQRPQYYAGTAAFEVGTFFIPFGKVGTLASKTASGVTKILAETNQSRKILDALAPLTKEGRQLAQAQKIAESIKPQNTIATIKKIEGTKNSYSVFFGVEKASDSITVKSVDKSNKILDNISNELKKDGMRIGDNADTLKPKQTIEPKYDTPDIQYAVIKTGKDGKTELFLREDFEKTPRANIQQTSKLEANPKTGDYSKATESTVLILGDLEKKTIENFGFTQTGKSQFIKAAPTAQNIDALNEITKIGFIKQTSVGVSYSNEMIIKYPKMFKSFIEDSTKGKVPQPQSKDYLFTTRKELADITESSKGFVGGSKASGGVGVGSKSFDYWLIENGLSPMTKTAQRTGTKTKPFGYDTPPSEMKNQIEELIRIKEPSIAVTKSPKIAAPPTPTPSPMGSVPLFTNNDYIYKPFLLTPQQSNNFGLSISESKTLDKMLDVDVSPKEIFKQIDKIKTGNDIFSLSDIIPDTTTKTFLWQSEKDKQKEQTEQIFKLTDDITPLVTFELIPKTETKTNEKIIPDQLFKTGWGELTIPQPPPDDPPFKKPPPSEIPPFFKLPDVIEEEPRKKKKEKKTKSKKRIWFVGNDPFQPFELFGYKDGGKKSKND